MKYFSSVFQHFNEDAEDSVSPLCDVPLIIRIGEFAGEIGGRSIGA